MAVEQGPQDVTLSRRRLFGLAVAGAVLAVDRKLPVVEKLPTENYEPVSDKKATIQRLQSVVNGERPATNRELFEAAADVVASNGDIITRYRPHLEGESMFGKGADRLFVGYYRGNLLDPSYAETAYIEKAAGGLCIEFQRFTDGRVKVASYDSETDRDVFVRLKPNESKGLAKLLLTELRTNQPQVTI